MEKDNSNADAAEAQREIFKLEPVAKVQWTLVTTRMNGMINFSAKEGTVVSVGMHWSEVKLRNGRVAVVENDALEDARLVSGITRMFFPHKAGKMKGGA